MLFHLFQTFVKCLMILFSLGMVPQRNWKIKTFQSQITVLLRRTLNDKKKRKKNVPVSIMTLSIGRISVVGPWGSGCSFGDNLITGDLDNGKFDFSLQLRVSSSFLITSDSFPHLCLLATQS